MFGKLLQPGAIIFTQEINKKAFPAPSLQGKLAALPQKVRTPTGFKRAVSWFHGRERHRREAGKGQMGEARETGSSSLPPIPGFTTRVESSYISAHGKGSKPCINKHNTAYIWVPDN